MDIIPPQYCVTEWLGHSKLVIAFPLRAYEYDNVGGGATIMYYLVVTFPVMRGANGLSLTVNGEWFDERWGYCAPYSRARVINPFTVVGP